MKVRAFNEGDVVRSTSKENLKRLIVETSSISTTNGFINSVKRIGFITLDVSIIDALGLNKVGVDVNAKLRSVGAPELKIIVRESLEAQHDKHEPKQYPDSHATKAGQTIVDPNGNPIYQWTEVVEKNSGLEDERILSSTAVAQVEPVEEVDGDLAP
jgi:hypothetical protein